MKKLLTVLAVLITILFEQISFGQNLNSLSTLNNSLSENLENKDSSHVELPRFEVHIGYGTISGGRIGLRWLFKNQFSIEYSYGSDWRNFISLSDEVIKHGVGLNWHFSKESNYTISLLGVYEYYPDNVQRTKAFYISPTIGIINLRTIGVKTFIRSGVFFELYNYYKSSVTFDNFGFNLDIGLTFSFP